MKIFNSIEDFKAASQTIVTLGTFDGVHLGHEKIIKRLIQSASSEKFESLVLTFFPHPRMVLQNDGSIKLLNTIDERASLLKKAGLDNLIIHPFDQKFSQMEAEDFVKKILIDIFRAKKIIIGYDHRFGKNRSADINDLIRFGKKYNFEVEQISAEEIDAVSISSTKIRKALLDGNIGLANEYLGHNYVLSGTVQLGKQLGRTINFPTANLKIEEDYKLIPQNGVYIVKSNLDGKTVYGMMNIGINPTVGGTAQSIEIHYLNFEDDLYGKKITVEMLKRIRSEEKFPSFEALKIQLEKDKQTSIDYINLLQ